MRIYIIFSTSVKKLLEWLKKLFEYKRGLNKIRDNTRPTTVLQS